jgi:hypothetical protein
MSRGFVALLSANIVVLACWTVIDPLTYVREATRVADGWNRIILPMVPVSQTTSAILDSVGLCESERASDCQLAGLCFSCG